MGADLVTATLDTHDALRIVERLCNWPALLMPDGGQAERDRLWAEAQGRARDARARENARRSRASHRINKQRGAQPVSVVNEWCGLCRSWQPRPHVHRAEGVTAGAVRACTADG